MSPRIFLIFAFIHAVCNLQAQELLYPKMGMVQLEGSVQFSWNPCQPSSVVELQVATNNSFNLPSTYFVQNTDTLINFLSGQYFVRTRCTPTSPWTVTKHFKVIDLTNLGNLVLWLDASDTASLTKDLSNNLSRWENKVNPIVSFTQTAPAKQPKWIPNVSAINNMPVIRFYGNDVLSAGDILDLNFSSRSIFLISKANDPIADQRTLSKSLAAGVPNRFSMGYNSSGTSTVLFHGSSSEQILNIGSSAYTLQTVSAQRTATNGIGKLYSGGTQIGNTISINPNTYNFNSTFRFLIGAYNNAADNGEIYYLNGDIPEIIMYDSFLSDSLRNLVEAYLRFKYAPPVNLGQDISIEYGYCDTSISAQKAWFNSYLWNTGETTATIQVNKSGIYSVSVTDVFGYTSTDEIEVLFNAPNVNSTYSSCFEDNFNLDIDLNQDLIYVWNGIDTSSSFTSQSSGDYYYTIFDTLGCSFSDSFSLSVDSFNIQLSLGNDTSICAGNEIVIVQEGTPNASSYLWNTGETSNSTSIDTSGLYYFNATNANSCVASDSINVLIVGQSPITNFLFDTVCAGTPTNFLNLSSAFPPSTISAYNWFILDDTLINPNPSYLFDSAGTYLVTLQTETSAGCISETSINVPVKLNPVANFSLSYDACINTPYTLTSLSFASGIDTIVNAFWDLGNGVLDTGQTIQHQYLLDGSYEVILSAQSSNGCTSSFFDTLLVVPNASLLDPPFLTQPTAGYTGISPDIQFDWIQSNNSVSNIFQLALDSAFNNVVAEENDTSTSNALNNLAPQTYYWRVGAISICGDTSYSTINSFTIIDLANLGNLVLWLDASDPASLTKDLSNNLSKWENKVNPAESFTQTTPAKQPQWISNVSTINNMPVIRFYGNNVLSAGDILDLNFSNRSIFLISKANSPVADQRTFAKSRAAGVPNRFAMGYSSGTSSVLFHGSSSEQILNLGSSQFTLETVTVERTASSGIGKLFFGGTPIGNTIPIDPNTYNFNSPFRFLIGAYNDATDNGEIYYLNGDIPEIIMYDSFLSDSLRNLVEAYLRFKYAPPVNLGPDISFEYGFCDTSVSAQKEWFNSYLWNTGDTTATIQVNQSGTYSVIVTDVFGYTSTDEIKISFNAPDVSNNYTSCVENSFSLDLDLNQTLVYVWNGTDTTSSFASQSSGSYFYDIYDTLGCSFSDTFTLTIDSFSLDMTLGNDTSLCTGNYISLLDSGNYPISSYLWSTGATTNKIAIGSLSSQFWLEAENVNQCVGTDTVFATVIGVAPTAQFAFDSLCETQSVNFTDNSISSGALVTSWNWDFGNADNSNLPNPSTIFSSTGIYAVQLEIGTVDGCFDDTTILVNIRQQPSANFSFDIICAGSDAMLNDESFSNTPNPLTSWLWDFGNGQISTTQIPSFTLNSEGIYPVNLLIHNEFGCFDSISKLVEIFPALIPQFSFSNTCIGDTVHFTDNTSSFSIVDRTWNFGFFNQSSSDEDPSFYYPSTGNFNVNLRLTNAIGCVSDTTQTITIRELPIANALIENNCIGNNVLFFDNSNTSLNMQQWEIANESYTGDSVSQFFNLAGNYTAFYQIEDAFGCTDDTLIPFSINELPQVAFDFSPNYGTAPLIVNFSNLSQGALDYFWRFGENGNTSLDENPSYTYTENGIYNITLVASNTFGCVDSLTKEIPIIPTDLDVEISNLSIQKSVLGDGSIAYTPSVLVKNVGSRTLTNVDLSASVEGENKVSETWEGTLTIGQAFIYEFSSFFVINNPALVDYICVEARNANDNTETNFTNNKDCLIQNGLIQSSNLYPNPGQDIAYMDVITNKKGEVELAVFDILGRIVLQDKTIEVENGYNQIVIDCRSLHAGEYFVRMIYQDEVYSQVLIITNK